MRMSYFNMQTTTRELKMSRRTYADRVPGYGQRKDKKKLTVRKCLCCSKEFKSEGIHNRVCDPCKNTSAWRGGNNEASNFMLQAPKGRPE